jgi:YesN/AraC family two-component response regulator
MNFKKPKHSVLFSWLVSYILILLIPIMISGLVYLKSVALFKNEIINNNRVMLTQLQQAFDGQLQDVKRLALQIAMNPKLRFLLTAKNAEALYSSYNAVSNVLEMNSDFNLYATANGNIQSFYIVFNNKDMVWAESAIFSKAEFFRDLVSDSQITYGQWLKIVEREYVGSYIPLRLFHMKGQPHKSITFIQSIPIGGMVHQANLVVLMDGTSLNQAIENINRLQKGSVYIVDRENQILFTNFGKQGTLPMVRYKQMARNVGLLNSWDNGKKVVISYISSHEADWKYVFVIPTFLFEEKLENLKNITLFGLLFCLIIGGCFVIWLVNQNYNPLYQVLRFLRNIKLVSNTNEINEYKLIQNSIYQVYQENEVINRRLQQQNETMRAHFLLRLLQGRPGSAPLTAEILENYQINLISDRFVVFLFYIEDYHPVIRGVTENETETQLQQTQQALGKLVQEQMEAVGPVFPMEYNQMIACIVNIRPGLEIDWEGLTGDMLLKTQQMMEERLNLSCSIAISGLHETLAGIAPAYQEAMDALEYRLLDVKGQSLFFYSRVQQTFGGKYNYFYTMEMEQKLTNSIKVGNLQQAMNLVTTLFSNFTSGKVEIKLAKCMMFDIISTIIKALNSEGILMECQLVTAMNPMEHLLKCKNSNEIKREIELILQDVCVLINERKKTCGKNDHLVVKVEELLQDRYSDVNMSLTQLAADLQMNPKYLSSLYKEATGVSIVDLLNRIRVVNAKKLLLQTELSIAEVASRVGYCNSNALIRAFKRVEGITPGQFKELK